METLLYFAYGSNMSVTRLRARVPDAQPLAAGQLVGHSLRFHKIGRDGSAKCDALATGEADDIVQGVLYRMGTEYRAALDRAEGLGRGYEIRHIDVLLANGLALSAFTYYATLIDPRLLPFDWYLEHVLRGAREAKLPPDYIETLVQQPSTPDPDPRRALAERALYRTDQS